MGAAARAAETMGEKGEEAGRRNKPQPRPQSLRAARTVGWQRCWLEGCCCRSQKAPNESGGRMMREHPQAKCCPQPCQAPTRCPGLAHGVLGCPLQPLRLCQHHSGTNTFLQFVVVLLWLMFPAEEQGKQFFRNPPGSCANKCLQGLRLP